MSSIRESEIDLGQSRFHSERCGTLRHSFAKANRVFNLAGNHLDAVAKQPRFGKTVQRNRIESEAVWSCGIPPCRVGTTKHRLTCFFNSPYNPAV